MAHHIPNHGYLLIFRKYIHGGLPVSEVFVICQNFGCLTIPKNKEWNTSKNIKLQAISPFFFFFTSCRVAYHMGRTWLFTSKNKQYISVVVCAKIHVVYQYLQNILMMVFQLWTCLPQVPILFVYQQSLPICSVVYQIWVMEQL